MSLEVHPLTDQPTAAWNEISKYQKVFKLNVSIPESAVSQDKVRFVCMSDTHSLTTHLKYDIPDGDIFLHAGDFTKCGGFEEVTDFNNWLGRLPHKYKVVIAGNHELSFDSSCNHYLNPLLAGKKKEAGENLSVNPTSSSSSVSSFFSFFRGSDARNSLTSDDFKKLLTNCIYLEDEAVTLFGIKIYGTPWQPEFHKWAFNLKRGEPCLEKWEKIPSDTDVLLSHSPPLGFGDLCCTGVRAGCAELLSTVQKRVCPKYHVFGHIHESYGVTSDGKIVYVNSSTCDINYLPNNKPIVFDMALPPGSSKD